MTENKKTLAFAGSALAILLLALFVSRPQVAGDSVPADLNTKFFPKFEDPLAAKSLEIVDYDEETGQKSVFKVAQDARGIWSIPSHGGYPADAEKQLAEAAASVIDLKKGILESTDRSQQETYGVVAPPDEESGVQQGKGVGKQVTFRDKEDNILAQFVIGKEVKGRAPSTDFEAPQPVPLRYVRVPGSDAIYTAAVKIDKLSTRFDDWIEKDLLKMKLGVHSVKEMLLKDYTVNVEQGAIDQRGTSTLAFDSKNSSWTPVELKRMDALSKQFVARPLGEDEEVDNQKLNDMKNALNDLRIADVQRKPAGLAADLQAKEEFRDDPRAIISLNQRGFYPATIGGRFELVSKDGEVRCRMEDGVEYVLRFGNVSGRGKAEDLEEDKLKDEKGGEKPADEKKGEEAQKPADDKPKKDDADKTVEARRFLFVAVEFNPDMIPKPELEALPAEDAKPEDKKSEEKPDGKKDDKESGEKKEANKKESEEKAGEDKKDEKKPDDKKADEGTEEKKPMTERERVEAANKTKQEDYDKLVKKGEERVAELNRRFADWYYVIPDRTYQKIHLTQADIIKKKTPPADQAKPGADAQPPGDIGNPFLPKVTPPQSPATTPAAPKTPQAPPKSGTAPKKPAAPKTDAKK